jgi:hypothetical protein
MTDILKDRRLKPTRIAIAGLGAVGLKVAEVLDAGLPGCVLTAVSAKDHAKARDRIAHFKTPVPVVPIGELEPLADTCVRGHETHALNSWAKSAGYRRRIPGVCLGHGGGFGCLGHRHELLRC